MSKPIMSALIVGVVTAAGVLAVPKLATAAELQLPPPVAHVRQAAECGSCGCLRVSYDYHRELRTTYGTGFDPRNFDTTEPHYYFGPVRAYPQYWVEANSLQ